MQKSIEDIFHYEQLIKKALLTLPSWDIPIKFAIFFSPPTAHQWSAKGWTAQSFYELKLPCDTVLGDLSM